MSLKGIRVIDLSRVISGPFCSALLADLGADVIKVEPRQKGDPVREQGVMVGAMSSYFANYNRNKKSIALDLYTPEGKGILTDMLRGADVLVENFRPDIMGKMGFDADVLRTINPRLIHCNINGFGTDGPYADRPAFDFIVQAMSGFMSCNGGPDDPPLRTGVPIADLVCGLYAALGIAASLVGRAGPAAETGTRLSVSMLASLMSMLSFHATDYLNSGRTTPRTGNDHVLVAPYGLFATADGEIAIAPSNEAFHAKLVEALNLERLRADPGFATNDLRKARRAEVNAIVEAKTRTASSEYWIDKLNRAGVPCGPVYSLAQAFSDPQVRSQSVVKAVVCDGLDVSILGSPIRFDGSADTTLTPPPKLGEHTEEVLHGLGYGDGAVAALRAKSVI